MSHRRDRRNERERGDTNEPWAGERATYEFDDARHFASRDQETGQSRFAQRGQSTEERMPEDDSARRFPGGTPGLRAPERGRAPDPRERERGYYGSGGSYGYGGGFEQEGPHGHDDYNEYRAGGDLGRGNEEFYEATGGFGYDTSAYGRHGLGYPGHGELRGGLRSGQPTRGQIREDQQRRASGHEDARQGYSQGSGYWQSGGEQHHEQGSGYGDASRHTDGRGHEGGGTRAPRGRFYGRTPQGYTRSDERIREDVCDQLCHGHIDPSDVSVKVEGGMVHLEGFVTSRSEKFHVEELAANVLGVKDVENRLRVRREQPSTSAASTQPGESRAREGESGANNGHGQPGQANGARG